MIKITAILDQDRTRKASTSWLRVRSLLAFQCRMADLIMEFGCNDPLFIDVSEDLASMQWSARVDGAVVRIRLTEDTGPARQDGPSIDFSMDETEAVVRDLIERVLHGADIRQVA